MGRISTLWLGSREIVYQKLGVLVKNPLVFSDARVSNPRSALFIYIYIYKRFALPCKVGISFIKGRYIIYKYFFFSFLAWTF